jgi:hypothetical protein
MLDSMAYSRWLGGTQERHLSLYGIDAPEGYGSMKMLVIELKSDG